MESTLYLETDDGVDYWESWVDDGRATVHWGRLGERGETITFDDLTDFATFLSSKVRELHAAGFRNIPADEHEILLLEWPRSVVPEAPDEVDALWDKVEHFVDEELGWTGLGRCTGVDLSSELTALAEAVDAGLAVKVLASALVQSDLPPRAVIAVREDDTDIVRWPPERDGEDVSAGLP